MLKRAILGGETTGGAAHSGVFYRIDDHFGIGIPETKSINPISKTDWAETGVEPDVKVKAADALETAVKLAESNNIGIPWMTSKGDGLQFPGRVNHCIA